MSKNSKFFYDSLDDCVRRLHQTVVVHKNLGPVYVNAIQGLNTDQHADVIPLPMAHVGQGKVSTFPLTPEQFEIRKLPALGYVDTPDYSFYLSRRCNRQNKQGLVGTNIHIPNNTSGRAPSFTGLLCSKQFVDMLNNKYPRFDAIFDKVTRSDEPLMRSFSKVLALSVDDMESVSLWNRGIKVAVCNNPKKYGPMFRVPPKFRYLVEELQENNIRIE